MDKQDKGDGDGVMGWIEKAALQAAVLPHLRVTHLGQDQKANDANEGS